MRYTVLRYPMMMKKTAAAKKKPNIMPTVPLDSGGIARTPMKKTIRTSMIIRKTLVRLLTIKPTV